MFYARYKILVYKLLLFWLPMLNTIFSAYRALLFPVLLSWIRGRADVQSLKALGSQRQRLSMVSSKKPKMGRALCGCGESQGTQRQWNGCVCVCEGTGNRTGECVSGTRLGSTQHPLYFLRTHSQNTILLFFSCFMKMLRCTAKRIDKRSYRKYQ